jgi:hypothetical protein
MTSKPHLISIIIILISALSLSAGVSIPRPATNPKAVPPKCPLVTVSCPSTNEPPLTFTANVSDPETKEKISNLNVEYCWTLSRGKIAYGQGTNSITVDSPDTNSITATVDVRGLDSGCGTKASCSTSIYSAPLCGAHSKTLQPTAQ